MEFHKYVKQSGMVFWKVPKQRAKHALWLEKHKPKTNWTQAERQLWRKAKESVEYWEMKYEEENQASIKIGTPKPITPPKPREVDMIISGGMLNDS